MMLTTEELVKIVKEAHAQTPPGEDIDTHVGRMVLACAEAAYKRGLEDGRAAAFEDIARDGL